MNKNLNIVIDVSWIADSGFTGKITGGALRVVLEFLNELKNFPQNNFYLTYQGFLPEGFENLTQYRNKHLNHANIQVAAVKWNILRFPFIRKLFVKSYPYFPISRYFYFIPKTILNKMDIYYSPVDALPYLIRRNKTIKKYFTALDLIPLLNEGFSEQFKDYTKKLYDSLTLDTNIFAISENTKMDILKYRNDINPHRITVTYLGASNKFYFVKERELVLDFIERFSLKDKKYFLTINALAKYKNVDFIIQNFIDFCDENCITDLNLVVVGLSREKTYKDNLIFKYSLNQQILFLYDLTDDELRLLYNGARAFLYMSLYEGFGLPVLEAMQCGTPVICSNTSSIPEVIGDAGLTCNPLNSSEFKGLLNKIYLDDQLLKELQIKGIQQSKKFSWYNYASNIVTEFEKDSI